MELKASRQAHESRNHRDVESKNFELISWALFFFPCVVYLLLASLVGKEQKKTNFDGFFCCHQKNHRRKQQKHKKVSHFGSRSRVSMALQWPSNVEQPSYVVCQPTPLSHSEAKEREKSWKSPWTCVLEWRCGGEEPGMCVDENGILQNCVRIQWSWIMKSSAVERRQWHFKVMLSTDITFKSRSEQFYQLPWS